MLDQITITLRNTSNNELLPVYIDVSDNSLSRKWLAALNGLLEDNYHLEKNFCFVGFADSLRNAQFITERINNSIAAINAADIGYTINDHFTVENTIEPLDPLDDSTGGLVHDKMNYLHRYFEDLQGQHGRMSEYYERASDNTRWHIRQLNLLCHEYESLVLSMRKVIHAPEWQRPSQLMCWINAPRFTLTEEDYELFGIESINRPMGGVFVGVNKSVGKHHWEVFNDEGRNVDELITSTLISQTHAAGDFDIEWAKDPGEFHWQKKKLAEFREWLLANGFNPADKSLTIGHPQVGQVDLSRSFGTTNYKDIWNKLGKHLDVYAINTSSAHAVYDYTWDDKDYIERQVAEIFKGRQ